jgi:2,3-bisphosphoglycerate-independent phosphoglycerate mutase
MKYVIVIPDGAADEAQASLGGKTPLEAANIPHMDSIARRGILGWADNVPASLTAASDVATLSLFGYDPMRYYTGRAPLEARAMGIHLGPEDFAVRCNLVHAPGDVMVDFTAGHIGNEEGAALIATLQEKLGGKRVVQGDSGPVEVTLEFHPGVSYRNLMIVRNGAAAGKPPALDASTKTQAPHDVPDQSTAPHLPKGTGGAWLVELMEESKKLFAHHPANQAREAKGKRPATQCWLWGQGRVPSLDSFEVMHGLKGAIISAVDLVRGVGQLIGWKRVDVAGATGYLDTDYAAKGRKAIECLKDHDLVCVHVEAPDEASHEGRADAKVQAIEQIDEHIVGPLLRALEGVGEYRILIEPDHRTLIRTKAHTHGPVPFALAGTGIHPVSGSVAGYHESAVAADCPVQIGHQLLATRMIRKG